MLCNILLRGDWDLILGRLEWVRTEVSGLKQRELLGLLLHLYPRVDEVKSKNITMKRLLTSDSSDTTIHHDIQIQMNRLR